MTLEDIQIGKCYEEKYKQALSRATFYNNELLTENQRKMLLDIFPELKENEDEKARKELIGLISCMHDADPRKERWIAWLEKQSRALNPDKVIEWLECKAFQGWAEEINIKQIVNKFIKDFEL